MKFIKLLGSGINAAGKGFGYLEEGLNVINNELEKFNEEQQLRDPFRKIKIKSQEIKHIASMARIIIPSYYVNTHKVIDNTIEITDIIINLMNATIDTPAQRDQILYIFYNSKMKYKTVQANWKIVMGELYFKGLAKNSSTSDIIHFILDQEDDGELETIMLESLPKSTFALQSTKRAMTTLQEKGFITY